MGELVHGGSSKSVEGWGDLGSLAQGEPDAVDHGTPGRGHLDGRDAGYTINGGRKLMATTANVLTGGGGDVSAVEATKPRYDAD